MQKCEKRFNAILKKSKHLGISYGDLANLDVVRQNFQKKSNSFSKLPLILFLSCVVFSLGVWFYKSECFFEMPANARNLFRQPEDCQMCRNVHEVNVVQNISPSDFEHLYVEKTKPVVISDATKPWSAMETFSFDFFKQLYLNESLKNEPGECQFFPYKTEFKSLKDALNMDKKRSRLEEGTKPWYVGWSNCNDQAGKVLKTLYDRPYFLPTTSENIALNWIFMGGPGFGAHMHVDNVHYPSWQAQIRGRKLWKLAPPPECLYQCKELQVLVNPGDIIVVDTNKWYHQTTILPGDISITIGSEFD